MLITAAAAVAATPAAAAAATASSSGHIAQVALVIVSCRQPRSPEQCMMLKMALICTCERKGKKSTKNKDVMIETQKVGLKRRTTGRAEDGGRALISAGMTRKG